MKRRKGIILAGGTGSRLMPMTGLLSKQIIPVYDKPMIYYPLSVLMLAEISEILVISSPEHLPQIKETILRLGNLGVRFEFIVQQSPDGIAQALSLEKTSSTDPQALLYSAITYSSVMASAIFYKRLTKMTLLHKYLCIRSINQSNTALSN